MFDTAKFRDCWERQDHAGLAALYADDAVFDVTVGPWRYQRQGTEAILDQLREDYPTTPRIERWDERPLADGAVIEVEERLGEPGSGDEHFFRYVHLLTADDAGRIVNDVIYCSGAWDTATVERQRREAPMVRW